MLSQSDTNYLKSETQNLRSTFKARSIVQLTIAILLLLALCKTAVAIWAVPRGIELGDEGFYLMAYKYWSRYRFIDFFVICGKWLNSSGWTVVQLRFLKIALEVTGVTALCLSYYRYAVYKHYIKPSVGAALLFVGFVFQGLYISFEARSASYNDFCVLLNYLSFSCLLLIFSEAKSQSRFFSYCLSGFAGLCGGLLLAPKFPSAFVHPLAIGGLLFFNSDFGQNKIKLFAVYATGFAIGSGSVIAGLGGLSHWSSELSAMFEFSKFLGYGFSVLLRNHLISVLLIALAVTASVLPFTLYHLKNRDLPKGKWIVYLTILFPVFPAFIFAALTQEKFCARETVFTINSWLALSYFFMSLANVALNRVRFPYFLLLISILIPLVIIVGTNTPLMESLHGCSAPVLCILFIFLYKSVTKISSSVGFLIGGFMVVSLNAYFFITYLLFPYGLDTILPDQQLEYSFRSEKILVSSEAKKFFETARNTLKKNGFEEGDPIIALDLYPGFVYVLGGYSPGAPWYAIQNGNSYKYNCRFYKNYNRKAEQGKLPWVMFFQNPQAEQSACLKNSPINFPSNYVFLDSIYSPYSQNPDFMFGGHMPSHIKIYAPAKTLEQL